MAAVAAGRTPLIAGNWKMNLDHLQAIAFVQKLAWTLQDKNHDFGDAEVAVFPPFTDIRTVQTLIDADKQRTPVADGVPTADVPRDLSFCNAAIAFDTTMVVPDTRLDDRFRTNPYVVGAPRIRFYAGHPINGPGGHRIGVLCLLDDTPHTFSSSDRRKLRTLAALVQLEMVPPRTT